MMLELAAQPTAADFRAWLVSHRWHVVSTKAGGGELWRHGEGSVIVPASDAQSDAQVRMQVALQVLAAMSGTSASVLADEIAQVRADVMEWRVVERDAIDNGLPLAAADQLLSTVRKVLTFGAASVDHRRGYFGKRVRRRARAVATAARVAQTKAGSFVLPVVWNLPMEDASDATLPIGVEWAPFSRQVLATVQEALGAAATAAVVSPDGPTPRQASQLVPSGLSYEMSVAMADLLESKAVESVDISFRWARAMQGSAEPSTTTFTPQHSKFFRRLAGSLFETSEIGTQRFLLSVKASSRFDEAGRDGGVVTFRRYHPDGSRSLVRAELNEQDYQTVLLADGARQRLSVVARLVEEEGHRARLEDIVEVRRSVQGEFPLG